MNHYVLVTDIIILIDAEDRLLYNKIDKLFKKISEYKTKSSKTKAERQIEICNEQRNVLNKLRDEIDPPCCEY